MNKFIGSIVALLLLVAPASADYLIATPTIPPPNAIIQNVKAGNLAGNIVNWMTPVDASGAAFGTVGNPIAIGFGTGVTLPSFSAAQHFICDSGCGGGGGGGGLAVNFAGAIGAVGTPVGFKDGSGNFQPALGDVVNGQWVNVRASVPIAVTGTFFQATQPISGSVSITGSLPSFGSAQHFICDSGCSGGGGGLSVPFAGAIGANGTPGGFKDGSGNFQSFLGDVTNGQWVSIKSSVAIAVTGTFFQATQPISAVSLPLPTGAATQTTLASVLTALGSPFQAGASIGNTAFGISGTLPAFAATPTFNLGTLNGAATASNQTAVTGPLAASSSGLATVSLITGAQFLSTQPTITNAQQASLLLSSRGELLVSPGVSGFPVTLTSTTITGTVAVTQSGSWSLAANQSVNVAQINGVTPLMGNGTTGTGSQRVTIASDNTAFSVNAVQSGTWNITNISGTVSLPTGAASAANQTAYQAPVAPNTATATKSVLIGGQFNATQETLTNAQQGQVALSARGAIFVAVGADGFSVTNGGTFAVQATLNATPSLANGNGVVPTQGGAVLSATNGIFSNLLQGNAVLSTTNPVFASITDGTTKVPVKAASTAPVAGDASLVTTLSPNTAEVGTPGTGISQPASGVGLSGWLSGIYKSVLALIFPNTASVTNPTSQLTLAASTSAFSVGNLVANSGSAGSVVVPSFAIVNSAGAGAICSSDLTSDDSTTGVSPWAGVTMQVDFWRTAPTFTNGDHAAYVVATGSANYIGTMTGTYGPSAGDGAYARLVPTTGDCLRPKLASGTSVFWTLQVLTATAAIATGKHQTITAEVTN